MSEGLQIRKGGKLIKTSWKYNRRTKTGRYVESNVTSSAFGRLFDCCTLEEGVTLRDVLLLLKRHINLFDLVLGNWCKDLVEEGLKPSDEKITDIEYLELGFHAEFHEDRELYGYNFPQFHGTGHLCLEDIFDKYENLICKKGQRQSYAVEFTPVNDLAPLPLKLDPEFELHDWEASFGKTIRKENPEKFTGRVTQTFKATYTLGHILQGIVWELSFCGSPKMRNERKADLDKRVEDIQSGKAKLIPWEDVKKGIEKKLEKSRKKRV